MIVEKFLLIFDLNIIVISYEITFVLVFRMKYYRTLCVHFLERLIFNIDRIVYSCCQNRYFQFIYTMVRKHKTTGYQVFQCELGNSAVEILLH